MSYDIGMTYPPCPTCKVRPTVVVDAHEEGGTYVLGGTDCANLNVTYNYAKHFFEALDPERGIRWLYGKTGRECAARLERAIIQLGTARDGDYWAATPGNAGHALSILLRWARKHPDAVFDGD